MARNCDAEKLKMECLEYFDRHQYGEESLMDFAENTAHTESLQEALL